MILRRFFSQQQHHPPALHAVLLRYLDHLKLPHPPRLLGLLRMLERDKNLELVSSPQDGELAQLNVHPLVIPIAKNKVTGGTVGLLHWLPLGKKELQLVSVDGQMLKLLAPTAASFVHRKAAEIDVELGEKEANSNFELWIANEEGKLYTAGTVGQRNELSLNRYLARKVATFPDVLEWLALHHLNERKDITAALVACEWGADCNRGWARGHWFQSQILTKLDRFEEARDAARAALLQPIWTLNASVDEVMKVAKIESIEKWKEFRNRPDPEGNDKMKSVEETSLQQAYDLMNETAIVNGEWYAVRRQLVGLLERANQQSAAELVRTAAKKKKGKETDLE